MQNVKVRRGGISADGAADVLRSELGGGYEVTAEGESTVLVRRGTSRAKVIVRTEAGGTVFEVSGEGYTMMPLVRVVTKLVNENGIAKKAAAVIGDAEAFRGDG
jgi:hypothetical protein